MTLADWYYSNFVACKFLFGDCDVRRDATLFATYVGLSSLATCFGAWLSYSLSIRGSLMPCRAQGIDNLRPPRVGRDHAACPPSPAAARAYGANMKTSIRFVIIGVILLARCAWAAESSPVAFAKSVVSERGSQTFATVSYPDRSLIVEFRLEPYSADKATAVRAFGEITKKIAQGAFSKFPKLRSVQVIGNLALRDKRGNETVDRAVMVKFSKVNAATINWENIDPATIVGIADKHWLLPELSADKK